MVDNLSLGGIQKIVIELSRGLSEKNKVSIYQLSKTSPFYPISSDIKIEHISVVENQKYNLYKLKRKLRFSDLQNFSHVFVKDIIKKVKKNKYTTIILSDNSVLIAKELREALPTVKIVLWFHSTFDTYFNKWFKDSKIQLIESMNAVNNVVVLTEDDKKKYEQLSNNIVKINNPLTIKTNGEVSALNKKIISFTGRFVIEPKGLDYLVGIAKTIPRDWKISLAGSGTDEEIQKLNKLIMKNKIENQVVLQGALNGEALNQHYINSSIFIMTSRWEGFGLVLTEAMSFGLPVIAFHTSGSDEVIQDNKFGFLVEQGNIDKFSEVLNKLINSQDLRNEYSKKSLVRVKGFSMNDLINEWEKIL